MVSGVPCFLRRPSSPTSRSMVASPGAHAPLSAPDHAAAASAGAAAGVAAPTELAELCCTVVVVFLAAVMWRWWRHYSAYEAEQHARGAGGLALAPSPLPSPRQQEPRRVQRSASFGTRSSVAQSDARGARDDSGGSAGRAPPLGRRRSSATDAQQQRRERHAQLMGLLLSARSECESPPDGQGLQDDRPLPANISTSDTSLLDNRDQRVFSPLPGPRPVRVFSTAPAGAFPRLASSGSRYAAQILKRRGGSTSAGPSPVSPVSQSHSAGSPHDLGSRSPSLDLAEPRGPEAIRYLGAA